MCKACLLIMNNASFLCRLDTLADGAVSAIDVQLDGESTDLILYRRGDSVVAYHNVCPHAGRRLDYAPGQFLLRAGQLICAAHGATFDVIGGRCTGGPGGGGLSAVPVVVIDGEVRLAAPST